MNVSRKTKITNVEILCGVALPSLADILIEKNLRHVRLLGHMHRMDSLIINAAVVILSILFGHCECIIKGSLPCTRV